MLENTNIIIMYNIVVCSEEDKEYHFTWKCGPLTDWLLTETCITELEQLSNMAPRPISSAYLTTDS